MYSVVMIEMYLPLQKSHSGCDISRVNFVFLWLARSINQERLRYIINIVLVEMNRVYRLRNIVVLLFLIMIAIPAVSQRFSVVGGDGLYSAYYEDYRSTSGINAVFVVYGDRKSVV